MEEDHDAERRELAKMLGLTGNCTGSAETSTMYRTIFERLTTLDSDMRRHVHLEDHILFPRVESWRTPRVRDLATSIGSGSKPMVFVA